MSYPSDSLDWQIIEAVDKWLDDNVDSSYKTQVLAQDWARISKIAEELGEAINEFILFTGQNPRKGSDLLAGQRLLLELADTAMTAIFAIQHFTKDTFKTRQLLIDKQTIL